VPTDAQRNGDFTGSGVTLVNPTNTLTGEPLRDSAGNLCVVANRISPGCITPVARNLLQYVPNSASGTVVSLAPSPISENLGVVRADWNQSEKHHLFGHYYQSENSRSTPFAGGGNIPGYMGENFEVAIKQGTLNDTYSFTPTLINQAVFSVLNSRSSELICWLTADCVTLLICAAFVKLSVSAKSQNTFRLSICIRTRNT